MDKYLIRFAKDYIKLFSVLAFVLGTLLYFMSDSIISILFGEEYAEAAYLFDFDIGNAGCLYFKNTFW